MCGAHLFSPEELEKLDAKQIAILDAVILREIQTSPEIREMLRAKIKELLYDRWEAENRAREERRGEE